MTIAPRAPTALTSSGGQSRRADARAGRWRHLGRLLICLAALPGATCVTVDGRTERGLNPARAPEQVLLELTRRGESEPHQPFERFSIAAGGKEAASTRPTQRRGPAPLFQGATLDGGTLRLEDFRGRVVLLDFWATWCIPCRVEMPDLQALASTFEGKPFTVLGINQDRGDARAKVRSFLDEHGVTFPQVLDPDNVISSLYCVASLPARVLLDAAGQRVEFPDRGRGQDGLREAIERLIPKGHG